MKSILSTKKLAPHQRDLLVGQGVMVVDYNAIEIEFIDFKAPNFIENAIFTSQNGVISILNSEFRIQNSFCVGEKTKALLEQNGKKVVKMAENSKEMGDFLVKNCKNDVFHYICGMQRREELPDILKASKIDVSEVKTYKTVLKPSKFDEKWGKILFFSPSGVESFMKENNMGNATVFCIGETTAEAARTYTSKVEVADKTSVESVIEKAINSF